MDKQFRQAKRFVEDHPTAVIATTVGVISAAVVIAMFTRGGKAKR